jgi:PAS domain S-box-containing protein
MLEPMTGYREPELGSGHICPMAFKIMPEDHDRITAAVSRAIDEKKPFDMEYAFSHKSGAIRYLHERGRPVFDENGDPLYIDGVIFDITENREAVNKHQELEKQLRQAQKLEALGALAGGITHDFNNILTSIYGYSQLALLELPDESRVRTYLKDMHDAANRARELVKQILTFSRQEPQTQSPVEVGIIVKEALKLLRASIPATIEIRQNIDRNAGSVLANPTQIHQILMNLCTNAYHAMRETGGVLRISLTPEKMTGGEVINGVSFTAGSYLHLEVSDTGHGMDGALLDRIFEPYFTTKTRGEGTGMGLSVVHGIVKSHGGYITVNSEPGKGSAFHIYWPAIAGSAVPLEMESAQSLALGNETILLVDDEDPTLLVEQAILERLGYRVASFSDPNAALAEFRENTARFDLVVTDMTMPEMTGVDFFKAVRALRPEIPVVLCTGYSEIITEKAAKKIGISAFILKPVQIGEFAAMLRKLLDERRETN